MTFVLVSQLAACNSVQKEPDEVSNITVYYINRDETKNVGVSYYLESTETDDCVKELVECLKKQPASGDLRATIPGDLEILSMTIFEGQLTLDFSSSYRNMSFTAEVLFRAAVVRTLTQLDEIRFVQFLVEGEPLTGSTGEVVGLMSSDLFFDNAGGEISTNEHANLVIYFANSDGDRLIAVNRAVEYNSNVAIEKVIAEQLISGPVGTDTFPTINPDTKILNVSVTDGVCYVNLDSAFLVQTYSVNSDVVVYSLVNSLTNLKHVNKVQILVNGESAVTYRETVDLSMPLARNLDLLTDVESGDGN